MCLSTVKVKKESWKTGYKMASFDKFSRIYSAPYKNMVYGRIGDICKCDSLIDILADDGNIYRAGIHIFKTLSGVRAYYSQITGDAIILQVEYKDIVASGTEDIENFKCPVDIAKTMKIVKTLSRASRLKWDELINKTRTARARK